MTGNCWQMGALAPEGRMPHDNCTPGPAVHNCTAALASNSPAMTGKEALVPEGRAPHNQCAEQQNEHKHRPAAHISTAEPTSN